MSGLVPIREFRPGDDMAAHYRAVRARLNRAPVMEPVVIRKEEPTAPEPVTSNVVPINAVQQQPYVLSLIHI